MRLTTVNQSSSICDYRLSALLSVLCNSVPSLTRDLNQYIVTYLLTYLLTVARHDNVCEDLYIIDPFINIHKFI